MSVDDKPPYKGSCLCGEICYEVDRIEAHMGHCHCRMCRKFHGAEHATFGEALSENFRWTKGEDKLQGFVGYNGTVRKFCKLCGSSLIFMPSNDDGSLVEFALGTLDSDIPNRPDAHIYLNYMANWTELHDSLPRHGEGRSSPTIE